MNLIYCTGEKITKISICHNVGHYTIGGCIFGLNLNESNTFYKKAGR